MATDGNIVQDTTFFLNKDGQVEAINAQSRPSAGDNLLKPPTNPNLPSPDMIAIGADLLSTNHVIDAPTENIQRQVWGGKMEFIFSCLSYAVGLGNVWRYPYLCYKNGGGAFLIPFTIMLIFLGLPMLFLESAFGQYTASGPITVWKISPLFEGIGWAMVLVTFFASIYYCMLIAWTMFYLFASFASDVPWRHCTPPWSTPTCVDFKRQIQIRNCTRSGGFYSYNNKTCFSAPPVLAANASDSLYRTWSEAMATFNRSHVGEMYWKASETNETTGNLTELLGKAILKPKTPSDEYFHNFVLDLSNGFHEMGVPKWELALCLLLSWTIVVLCLIRGVKSAGKAVYFTALFPYLILTILFVRGLTLDGSMDGLKYYFLPEWKRLLVPKVWGDAAVQIFFSLNPCWGGLIALASYNKYKNNVFMDSMIVAIGDGLTSIFAGMVIFAILGYMSNLTQMPVEEVAQTGAGLAFIVYPDIVTTFPLSPLWAILFFMMLLTLGFGTMISNVNCIYTSILDFWPKVFRKGRLRPFLLLCSICLISFLLGLSCTTQGGIYMLQLLDNYAASYSVLIIGLTELIVIGWIYGIDKFVANIEDMLGRKMSIVWKIIWKYVGPAFLIAVLIFTFVDIKPSSYGSYTFPKWSDALGGLLSVVVVSPIPVVAVYKVWRSRLPIPWYQRARELMKPDRIFGARFGEFYSPEEKTNARLFYESQNYLLSNSTINSNSMLANSQVINQTPQQQQHRV